MLTLTQSVTNITSIAPCDAKKTGPIKIHPSFDYLFAQVCFVMIESLSHTTDDLIFKWNFTNPLYVSPEIQLPQVEYSKVHHRLDIRSCAIFSTFIVSFASSILIYLFPLYLLIFSPNQFQLELEQAKTEDCTIEYSTGTFTCLAAVFKMRRNPGRDRASLLPYIIKVKKSADSTFQSQRIRGKSA